LIAWLVILVGACTATGEEAVVTPQITVDQFGWLPRSTKVAILADPIKGQNAGQKYQPGDRFEIRREPDGVSVYKGRTKPWNMGKVSELAGDRVWHADFSNLRDSGTYHVYDPANRAQSFSFRIADDVYRPVLRDAVRVFYYQRSGTPITEQNGGAWHHPGGHLGRNQDHEAQLSQGGKTLGRPRDLVGGWFDAGDLNKYVPYLESTLFDLLWAYERNPQAFGDDLNIPESGNGVPDLLDEVKWELDWLLRMEDADGGFFNRVAGRSFDNGSGPPSGDTQPRFYTAKTTWATADAAASLAHASRIYALFEEAFPGYAKRLGDASRRAWAFLEAHPAMEPADGSDGDSKLAATPAGSNANGDRRARVFAAAELFKMLGEPGFKAYVDRWATDLSASAENGKHPLKDGKRVDPLNHVALTQALFVYATTEGANPKVVEGFKEALSQQLGKGALGPCAPYDDRAGAEPRTSRDLPRAHCRLPAFPPRPQSALSMLPEQHGQCWGRPVCDRNLPPMVSRRLTAL
jgi:hypothetical protein